MADELTTRIKEARIHAGMSREQFAGVLGVSFSTVVRLETGRTKRISAHRLVGIANATGKPLSFFLEEAAA